MKPLVILLLCCAKLVCQGQEAFDIKNYQVKINVTETGVLEISESMDVFFRERRRGIIRKIPYKYTAKGEARNIRIRNVSVKNNRFQQSKQNQNIVLKIGDPNIYVTEKQRYDISYEVENAILIYDNHAELYWNVIGFDSDVLTEQASFSIRFPDRWRDSLSNYIAFTGKRGSKSADLFLSKKGAQITGAITQPLQPREGITLAVQLPKSLIGTVTGRGEEGSLVSKVLPVLPVGLAGFLLMFWRKWRRKDDDQEIVSQQYPPENFSPAEVGTFYDYKANRRDIIALLPYWGELGCIEIERLDSAHRDLYFRRLEPLPNDRPDYEHIFYNALFDNRDGVLLSDLKHALPSTMRRIGAAIKNDIASMDLYDPNALKWVKKGGVIAIGVASILLGIFFIIALHTMIAGIGMIIVGVAAMFIALSQPKLSSNGRRIHNHLKGLYQWLKDPDPREMNALLEQDSGYLHRIFPYVLAFDLDKSWESRWEGQNYQMPPWYILPSSYGGRQSSTYGQFAKDFQPHSIEQVFYTPAPPAPSNSSSGGGFSSGSAGGGFGGGSVSSW